MKAYSEKALLGGLGVVILFVATGLVVSWLSAKKFKNSSEWVSHTNKVLYHSERVLTLVLDNETGSRGYALTGNEAFLEPFRRSSTQVTGELNRLQSLVSDNEKQLPLLDSITRTVEERLAFSSQSIVARQQGGLEAAAVFIQSSRGKELTDKVRKYVIQLQKAEEVLLQQREQDNEKTGNKLNTIMIILGVLLLVFAIFIVLKLRLHFSKRNKLEAELEKKAMESDRQLLVKTNELKVAFERISDAFVSLDVNWCYTYMNKKAGEIFNRDPEKMIGKNIWEEFPEGKGQPFHLSYEKAMKEQQYVYVQEYYPPYDKWFENNIYPSADGLSIFFRDITDKKKVELAAARDKSFVEAIINSSPDIIYIYDIEEHRNVFVNKGIQHNLGYTDAEIKEMGNQVLPLLMHPEDLKDYFENKFPRYSTLADGEILENEFRMVDKQGHWHSFIARESVFLRNTDGSLKQIFGITNDVTEKLKAQDEIKLRADQLQILGDNIPDSMIYQLVREPDGKKYFTYISKSIIWLLGISPEEVMKNPPLLFDLLEEEDKKKVVEAEEKSYKDLSPFIVEVRTFNAEGEMRWAHIRSIPRRLADGRVVWNGIHTDITESKRREIQLAEREQQLRLFVENSPAALAMFDKDMKYIITSNRWLKDYNLKESNVTGKSHYDVFPDIPVHWKEIHQRCLAGAIEKKEEDMFVRADGSIDWIRWEIHPWYRYTGEVGGIILFSEVITEKKIAQEVIKRNEERFNLAIMATKDGIWDWNILTNDEYFSPRWCEILGYDFDDSSLPHTYQAWAERIYPDHYDHVMEALKAHLEKNEPYDVEYLHKHKSGQYRWQKSIGQALFNEEGKPVRMVGSISDITERKNAEERMKESEEKYRSLVEQASDAIFINDQDGNLLDANSKACEMLGYSRNELRTMKVSDFYLPNELAVKPLMINELVSGKTTHVERNMVHKSGRMIPVDITGRMLSDKRIIAIVRDITERKKAEQMLADSERKLREVLSSSSDSFYVVDKELTVTLINKSAASNLLRAWGAPVVVGTNISGLIPDEKDEPVRASMAKVFSGENVEYELHLEISGLPAWVQVNYRPVYDDDGMIIGAYVSTSDISAKKEADNKIKESEEQYRTLIDRVTDGFVSLDTNWKFTYANKRVGEMVNLDPQFMIGKCIWELFPGTVNSETEQAIKSSFAEQRYVSNLDYYEDLDLWHENHIYPSSDGVSIFVRDVTEKKKAEEQIINANKLMETAEAHAGLGSWEFDLVNNKRKWSKQMFRLFDFPVTVESPTTEAVLDRVHPDDRHLLIAAVEAIQSNIEPEQKVIRTNPEKIPLRYLSPTWRREYSENGKLEKFSGTLLDVTVQKMAEEQILREKELSDSIINSLPGIFYLYDEDMNFLRWNKNFESVSGYSEKEVKSMMPLDFFDADEKELLRSKIKEVFKEGMADVEAHFLTKEGKKIPYYFNGWRVIFEGKPCLIGVGIDISERKKAEMASKESQETQRLIMQAAMDAIVCMDIEGRITVWTTQAQRIFGWNEKEAMGKKVADLIIPPAYRKRHTQGLTQYLKTGEGKFINQLVEVSALRNDGTEFPVDMIITLLNQGGKQFFCAFIRDISERKKAEEEILKANERFNLIARATNDFVWDADLNERKVWWNDNYYLQLGWKKGNETPDIETWEDHIHPRDKARVLKGITKALNDPAQDTWTDEYRFSRADGTSITVFDRGYILRNEKGKAYRLIGAMTDISDIKSAEEELRLSEEKYRLLFNKNPLPMWVLDQQTLGFLAVNEAALEKYGYSSAEFLSMSAVDIRPIEDRQRFIQNAKPKKNSLYNAGTWQHKKRNGEIMDVEVFAYPIIYEGREAELILVNEVTEKLKAELLLKKSYEDIRRLASHLEQVREDERISIAREIHDELGQQLTVLKMDISWLNKKLSNKDERIQKKMDDLLSVVDTTVKTVRRISSELRPSVLDNIGLLPALEWHCQEFQKRSGIATTFKTTLEELKLPSKITTGVFRILQESLTNVARHAGATRVDAGVKIQKGQLIMTITDNGRGFITNGIENKKTLGILGMRERVDLMGGEFKMISTPGKGTTITVSIPVSSAQT